MRTTADGTAVPQADITAADLHASSLYGTGDPHPIWTAMRRHSPVHRQELPDGREFWSVTKYDDVNDVLRDHTRFTSKRGTLLSILGGRDPAGGKMMAASDPPAHTAMRRPMADLLSARALSPLVPKVRRMVDRMLAPLADGTWNLARALADFPMAFTGTLMGLPESDWPRLTRLTSTAIAPDDPEFSQGDGTLASAHHELFSYFSADVRRRAGDPGDDLVGSLLRMDVGGRPFRHDELVYNCYSLLLGANVTTPHAVAGTVLALIEHPDEYRRLLADPELVPSAVEEGLRWSSPANHFMRHVTRPTEIRGVELRRGDPVVAWLGSANRDEEVFADPFRFDVSRSPNRHVAFGFGPHYCIGAPLARIALRLLVDRIVGTVAEFRLEAPVEHLTSNFVAGIKDMRVSARLHRGAAEKLEEAITLDEPVPLNG
ncbi:cytochrome P450 [Umezawaea sp. Da 62-37]|uniref:cytochrome P450 n=1 Tax=Umezawaea sp. Da 62-37 TaxID=3075927 RepID=UPI0028F6DA49|nr:cytochrome P450 [Umezawaea sp. Da 62-37]WNV84700.1 cytochrome P450 [Umezawaea sp. Da 62-37]